MNESIMFDGCGNASSPITNTMANEVEWDGGNSGSCGAMFTKFVCFNFSNNICVHESFLNSDIVRGGAYVSNNCCN